MRFQPTIVFILLSLRTLSKHPGFQCTDDYYCDWNNYSESMTAQQKLDFIWEKTISGKETKQSHRMLLINTNDTGSLENPEEETLSGYYEWSNTPLKKKWKMGIQKTPYTAVWRRDWQDHESMNPKRYRSGERCLAKRPDGLWEFIKCWDNMDKSVLHTEPFEDSPSRIAIEANVGTTAAKFPARKNHLGEDVFYQIEKVKNMSSYEREKTIDMIGRQNCLGLIFADMKDRCTSQFPFLNQSRLNKLKRVGEEEFCKEHNARLSKHRGEQKVLHSVGMTAKVEFKVLHDNAPHRYTGIFKKQDDGTALQSIMRTSISLRPKEGKTKFSPSFGMKMLVDGAFSCDIFGMYSFGGQETGNFLENPLSSNLPEPNFDKAEAMQTTVTKGEGNECTDCYDGDYAVLQKSRVKGGNTETFRPWVLLEEGEKGLTHDDPQLQSNPGDLVNRKCLWQSPHTHGREARYILSCCKDVEWKSGSNPGDFKDSTCNAKPEESTLNMSLQTDHAKFVNEPTGQYELKIKTPQAWLFHKMTQISSFPSFHKLERCAATNLDGSTVKKPKFPFALMFVPNPVLKEEIEKTPDYMENPWDFFQELPPNTMLYKVLAMEHPSGSVNAMKTDPKRFKCLGFIETKSHFVESEFADRQMRFDHEFWDKEAIHEKAGYKKINHKKHVFTKDKRYVNLLKKEWRQLEGVGDKYEKAMQHHPEFLKCEA